MLKKLALSVAALTLLASGQALAAGPTVVGLITKTETNPFFVKMKEGAQAKAAELGVKLLTGAGAKDGDNEGQVTAMENMINAGAKGILITPSDTKAIVPSIQKARADSTRTLAGFTHPGPSGTQHPQGRYPHELQTCGGPLSRTAADHSV